MIAELLRRIADWLDPPEPVGYEAFESLTPKERDSLWDMLADEVNDLSTRERVENELCQLTLGDMRDYLKAMEED